MIPTWIRWLHLVGILLYAGGFLALTRILAHVVRFEKPEARAAALRVLRRMHLFVEWPGLGILLGTGLAMLLRDWKGVGYMQKGYFHAKLTFILVLLVSDFLLSRRLFRLQAEGPQPSALFFRLMHGVVGLAILGALAAVTILKG